MAGVEFRVDDGRLEAPKVRDISHFEKQTGSELLSLHRILHARHKRHEIHTAQDEDTSNSLFLGTIPYRWASLRLLRCGSSCVCAGLGKFGADFAWVLWILDSIVAVSVTVGLGVQRLALPNPAASRGHCELLSTSRTAWLISYFGKVAKELFTRKSTIDPMAGSVAIWLDLVCTGTGKHSQSQTFFLFFRSTWTGGVSHFHYAYTVLIGEELPSRFFRESWAPLFFFSESAPSCSGSTSSLGSGVEGKDDPCTLRDHRVFGADDSEPRRRMPKDTDRHTYQNSFLSQLSLVLLTGETLKSSVLVSFSSYLTYSIVSPSGAKACDERTYNSTRSPSTPVLTTQLPKQGKNKMSKIAKLESPRKDPCEPTATTIINFVHGKILNSAP
ncbi:uncharacterized protein MYCFIDRAFT_170539 [Pseudocercospora fijiensis CIRAD86]|uniref:Uncharacterized protein n=1 Tax=Pseudocercospora fijiensis (strain CIRAD86) TaxID=383855 RepID=N1QAQ3_PSEFD|nr:uncharacterized protein MYCFIDRAFT_170539 [Pseudocercospora fijiensis CIRAD86]EME89001.1 hypothetical protein MYCFIDRAFT_170539 [Pseudocercospora fijiensis CIRAD86]